MTLVNFDKLNKMAVDRGKPFDVLIVDDEKWVQDVFRDFCELTDAFQVELASNGKEAISKINNKSFDLVTLDLIMPELSGLDVLMELKKINPQIPVMIITGNATDKLINEAGVMGACRVMYKPILLENFIAELTSTLSR
ncbi:MAG: response regulator [Calditrichaeota bacterium]|nr:MAG: response regulator [Calditrichota bacterium]